MTGLPIPDIQLRTLTHVVGHDASDRTGRMAVADISGSGTPGGSDTQVQFNNSNAFGGDAGFTYGGNGQATLALGTITTDKKALHITGTFDDGSTSFSPVVLEFSSTVGGLLLGIPQKLFNVTLDGVEIFSVDVGNGGGIIFNKDGFGFQHTNPSGVAVATYAATGALGAQTGFIGTKSNHPFAVFANNSFELMSWLDSGIVAFGAVNDPTVPALKPNGATLEAKLADDSAYTNIKGKLSTDTNATTGGVAGALAATTDSYLVLYDAAGTAYKVPAIAV